MYIRLQSLNVDIYYVLNQLAFLVSNPIVKGSACTCTLHVRGSFNYGACPFRIIDPHIWGHRCFETDRDDAAKLKDSRVREYGIYSRVEVV